MIDHSSARRFSTGVPVRAILRGATMRRTACACRAALFLMFCASSRTRRPQPIAASASMSRAASAVRRDDEVGRGRGRGEILATEPVTAVVDMDRKARREALRLATPVLDDGHRAHDEGGSGWGPVDGPGRALLHQQGQHLGGLAEPHVVGEACAEPETTEELQPGEAALLVWPERAPEACRRAPSWREPVRTAGCQEGPEPAIGGDPGDGEADVGRHQAQASAHHLSGGHRPVLESGSPLHQVHRRRNVLRAQLHPLAPDPHERHLEPGELADLVGGHLHVADRELPPVVDDGVEPEAGAGRRRAGLRARGGPQAGRDTRAPRLPPGRELDAEAGLREDRCAVAQEGVGAGDVEVEPDRAGLEEHPVQGRVESRRSSEVGQQPLLRIVDLAAERGEPSARPPDIGCRNEQAGVIGCLHQDLEGPGPVSGARGIVVGRDDPEAGAEPGVAPRSAPVPRCQGPGEGANPGGVRDGSGRRGGEGVEHGVDGRDTPRPGGGSRKRPAPDARSGDRVDDVGQHLREDVDRAASARARGPGLGTAGWRHRARQRPQPICVGDAGGRQPACLEAPAVPCLDQPGKEATPRGELETEQDGGGEVVERRVGRGPLGSTGEEQGDGRARGERERRDRPGFEVGPRCAIVRRCRRDAWRGPGVRRVTREREDQPTRSSGFNQADVDGDRGLGSERHAFGRSRPRVSRDARGPPRAPSLARLEGRRILGPEVQAAVERPGGVERKHRSAERA